MSRLKMTFMTAAMLLALAALTLNSLAQPPWPWRGWRRWPGRRRSGWLWRAGRRFWRARRRLVASVGIQPGCSGRLEAERQAEGSDQEPERQIQCPDAGIRAPRWGWVAPADLVVRAVAQVKAKAVAAMAGRRPRWWRRRVRRWWWIRWWRGAAKARTPMHRPVAAGGNRGNRGNRGQNGQGGVPEDPAVVAQRNEQRAMAREAMTELRQNAEASLAKILEKSQVTRLLQISLQLEGTQSVVCQNRDHTLMATWSTSFRSTKPSTR